MTLIRSVNEALGRVNYKTYSMIENLVSYGMPPVPLTGIDYVAAGFVNDQVKIIQSLSGRAVFAPNKNKTGVIEIGILAESVSSAEIQLLDYTGINFPIFATDGTTLGTSFIVGRRCKLIKTPEWRRGRVVGVTPFTFLTDKLVISHGLRAIK